MDMLEFGSLLEEFGFRDFVGVPCSFLSPLINYAINQKSFVMANNEGEAVAIASGISMARAREAQRGYGVVLMQNSGLSNALSPLTSLNYTFDIPILGFVSLRGERDEDGKNSDEPQHELLGRITDKLLEVCQIEYDFLSKDPCDARRQLQHASKVLQEGKPYFFIVKKGVLQKLDLRVEHSGPSTMIRRIDALEKIAQVCNEAVILATTGKSGRELYEIGDRPNQLYMVGSMGCVSTLGLGMMLKSDKKIVCIDGDGALLMRLGSLAVNARYAKERNMGNFCHILLDNESHDSTGGQFGLSSNIDFKLIARASGYEFIEWVESLDELQKVLKEFMNLDSGGAYFIGMKIKKGSKEPLGRPKITPKEVAHRLENFLINKV